MHECVTVPFLPEFSGCLVANPSCDFAVRCGFSYHCEHPNHKEFQAANRVSAEHADLPKRYKDLKESRRREFLDRVATCEETANLVKNIPALHPEWRPASR
jgi:hypothetical protein